VPARVVEHEDDVPPAPRAGLPGEGGEQGFEERFAQARGQEPDRLARGRLDEGGDVQPLVAVVAERDGPLADGRPNATPNRFQAEAVLVLGPDLDAPAGVRGPGLLDRRAEPPCMRLIVSSVISLAWLAACWTRSGPASLHLCDGSPHHLVSGRPAEDA
jgi:hypothetical protein